MKRFYKLVSTRAEAGGYAVLLDGKPVKTPGKNPLLLATEKLADAVQAEWAAQGDKIIPADMPLTQIASTCIDRVAAERPAMEKTVLEYLDTDLLCYRAEHPPELAAEQAKIWDPHLAWAARIFGAPFLTTTRLGALEQPEKIHAAARAFVKNLDNDRFTVFQLVTAAGGSFILAAALAEGAITPGDLFAAARVEEGFKARLYDEAKYGPDPAQEKKDAALERDLTAAALYISLLT